VIYIYKNTLEGAISANFSDSICIWDTDNFQISEKVVDRLVLTSCLCTLCVGREADELHNLIDATVELFEFEEGLSIDVDTRGGSFANYTLKGAIWEAENNMFPDVKVKVKQVIVLSSAGGDIT